VNKELKRILDRLERYEAINKEDIALLIREVNELYHSSQLAWKQLEIIEEQSDYE
jgi:hypothetical protein